MTGMECAWQMTDGDCGVCLREVKGFHKTEVIKKEEGEQHG